MCEGLPNRNEVILNCLSKEWRLSSELSDWLIANLSLKFRGYWYVCVGGGVGVGGAKVTE